MRVDISNLPPATRVWVYQAGQDLDADQERLIADQLSAFCSQWEAHGQALQSNFEVRNHRFVLLYVNEDAHAASGCSIDGSVRVMKALQQRLRIDFFDRTQVPFLQNEKIETIAISKLKNAFANGSLSPQTVTFNTLAATKSEIDQHWMVTAEKTWLAKYLPKPVVH
ncbi:MAG: hypothetical protein ACKOE6_13910 [Flammeovirgaceae bacterium]